MFPQIGVSAIFILIIFAIAGIVLFYKDGKLAEDYRVYSVVIIFALFLVVIAFISKKQPDIDKYIAIIGGATFLGALVIKKRTAFLSNIMLIISMSINIAVALL